MSRSPRRREASRRSHVRAGLACAAALLAPLAALGLGAGAGATPSAARSAPSSAAIPHGPASAPGARSAVGYTFPSPGDGYAAADTALTFRSIRPASLAHLVVTGSVTGLHTGTVTALHGGLGSVFTPTRAFAAGERVTVRAGVPLVDAPAGNYTFGVARAANAPPIVPDSLTAPSAGAHPAVPSASCAVPQPNYVTRPDLHPVGACTITKTSAASPDLILTTSSNPTALEETIYNNDSNVIWVNPDPTSLPTNLRTVTIGGQQMLAYFTGSFALGGGHGRGRYAILDDHYKLWGTLAASGNYQLDFHELQVTPDGNALVGSYDPVYREVNGHSIIVYDYVVQEIDFQHGGQVLFEWHALDHVPFGYSHLPAPTSGAWDYFHGNSIDLGPQGFLVSSRSTWGVYDIDPTDGHVIWTLGLPGDGPASFGPTLGNAGPSGWFCYQHDARWAVATTGDFTPNVVTLYDDGGAGPGCSHPARALSITVDPAAHTATVSRSIVHSPPLYSAYTGSNEALPNGNTLVDWANAAQITEYTPNNGVALDMRLGAYSYRAYKADWHGYPSVPPDAIVLRTGPPRVVVSWNGATDVAAWQLWGGSSQATLRPLGSPVVKQSFETSIPIPANTPVIEVRAVTASGAALPYGTTRLMSGSTYFKQLSGWTWSRTDYQPIVGDFGGSRDDDLLFYSPGSGPDYLLLADGKGGWVPPQLLPPITRTWTPLVGDFDGEGHSDVLWWQPGSTEAYLSRAPFTQPWVSVTVPAVAHALVLHNRPSAGGPAGDGVAWWQPNSPNSQIENFTWPAGSDTVTTSHLPFMVRYNYRPVSGDFDGNGYGDILWYGPGSMPDWVWYVSGGENGHPTSIDSRAVGLAQSNYEPIVGHFGAPTDGLSEDDVLLYQPGPAVDWLWRGSASRTFVSTDVTNSEVGPPLLLHHGLNDVVALQNPSWGTRIWNFSTSASPDSTAMTSTIEGALDPVRSAGYRVFSGDFYGPGLGSLYFLGAGNLPEALETPWTVGSID